jgi:hypothetical protein
LHRSCPMDQRPSAYEKLLVVSDGRERRHPSFWFVGCFVGRIGCFF